jgi:hypothetical protein
MSESNSADDQFEHWACSLCGLPIDDPEPLPSPCPRCGHVGRSGWSGERAHADVSLRAQAKVGRRKRWAVEESLEWQLDHRTGRWVKRYRLYDRRDDLYVERVFYVDTGEEVRSTQEPLSDHVGHGSAKLKDRSAGQAEK